MKNLLVSAINVHDMPDNLGFTQRWRFVYHAELIEPNSADPTCLSREIAERIDRETPIDTDLVGDLEWIATHPRWISLDPAKDGRAPVLATLDRFREWRGWFPRHAAAGRLSFMYLGSPNETYPFMRRDAAGKWVVTPAYEEAFQILSEAGVASITDRVICDVYRRPDWDGRHADWQALTIDYAKRYGKPVLVLTSPLRANVRLSETVPAEMFEGDVRAAGRRLTIRRGDRVAVWIPWTKPQINEDTLDMEYVRRDWSEAECLGNSIRKLLGAPLVTQSTSRTVPEAVPAAGGVA
jgi:hypothetical protein